MFQNDKRVRIALLSVLSNTLLIILKIVAGVLSGSVSIISEAIHSSMDLAASVVAFFSVKESMKPADEKHPYGHGKIENFSAIVEGVLIFVAALLIIYEAIMKIVKPAPIEQTNIAIAVMATAAVVNAFVSKKLYKVSKEVDSMALEADALHLKTDVITSAGVAIGLLLLKLTNIEILDPICAILVALLIIKEASELTGNAFNYLLDAKLSDEEEAEIISIIEEHSRKFIDFHKLKTRKSGNTKHIDFHITVDQHLTVREAHDIVAQIKKDMNDRLKNTRVTIHFDPYIDPERDRD